MGINVYIQRLVNGSWEDHSEWDSCRYAGDRELTRIIRENGGVISYGSGQDPDDLYLIRPADLDQLSKASWPPYNPNRWAKLIEILKDPQWWIYLSY